MKKIFLLFTIIATLFTSCSNDNDSISDNSSNDTKTYPLSFKIANPSLNIDELPLRLKSVSKFQYLTSIELLVYNEAGDQVMNFFYNTDNNKTTKWLLEDGSAQIELSLPKGVYHIAFYTILTSENTSFGTGAAIDTQSNVHNFFTYYYPYEATYNYYESITTTVTPTNQTIERDITLKPMWSNLNLTLDDAQTLDVPNGTDALQFVISPLYTGFHLDSKLATQKVSNTFVSSYSKYKSNIVSLDSIKANTTFTYPTYVYQTLPENGNLAINIKYLKTKNTTDTITLDTRTLKIPAINIENGYNYNIHGNLGSKNSGQSMNISLGEFNKDDVNIEF